MYTSRVVEDPPLGASGRWISGLEVTANLNISKNDWEHEHEHVVLDNSKKLSQYYEICNEIKILL